MSKLLLSNNNSKELYLHGIFQESGFKRYNNLDCGSVYGKIYKKLNVENENFLKIGDDYIGVVGTIIYGGIIGDNALRNMYSDYISGENIRNNAIGNYILLIKQGSVIRIITDDNAMIDLYYYSIGLEWVLTNTYYHLGKVIEKFSINKNEVREEVFQNAIVGKKTPIRHVYRLQEDEEIMININTGSFSVFEKIETLGKDYNYKTMLSRFYTSSNIIAKNFNSIAISMTGGLDSRLILASFLSAGKNPYLLYGVGNTYLTNTKIEDFNIVEKISKDLNLKLEKMNWETRIPIDETWDEYLEKYGELAIIYDGNKNIFSFYEDNNQIEYITFGYFGEFFKNVEFIDTIPNDCFTLQEYVSLYFNNRIPFNDKDEVFNSIYMKFYDLCDKLNLDRARITKDEFALLDYHYRKVAHNRLCNLLNLFNYSTMVLSDKIIVDNIINCPYKEKTGGKLVLNLIKDLYPKLLVFPFYSHCKKMRFDSCNENLVPIVTFNNVLRRLLKKLPLSGVRIRFFLRKLRRNQNQEHKLFIRFSHDQEKYGYQELLKSDLDLRHVTRYLQKMYLMRNLEDFHTEYKAKG